ncbi:Uncharacterised protein [Legionella beliardensis]|uniref:Bacterial surface protein 26-residue repeat n=1 Tax=Legionella beliardensis TaxID=91822 RepID=A0A378JPX5_9GAMM|nr:leucine-rich repeat domain-containing protein [Legionella beliardensis]STX55815.1 Uncharacterised protein [Legionella beliardensis]
MQLSDSGQTLLKVDNKDIQPDGSYEIPKGVTAIGNDAFYKCKSLTRVEIPASVTSIGHGAFARCINLHTLTIPASVTSIGDGAFYKCKSLTRAEIPASVTVIGNHTFKSCTNLHTLTIPASVTSIGDNAFCYCESLTKVEIPASVTYIGKWAFAECNLQTLKIPASVTYIGDGAFSYCESLTKVEIPASVTAIGNSVFEGCGLYTLRIPASVTSIGDGAFYNCQHLTRVEIPASVTRIGERAFTGCTNLTYIIIHSNQEADLAHIAQLLPAELKDKFIIKNLFDEITHLQDRQLSRLIRNPQTNLLYRFFNVGVSFVPKVEVKIDEEKFIEKESSTLPGEVFWHINEQLDEDNPYYHKAKTLIERESWPKTTEGLKNYEACLKNIVDEYMDKAWCFNIIKEKEKECPLQSQISEKSFLQR